MPLDQIGREWNEDEVYGFEGDHVLLEEGFGALLGSLSENLDIEFGCIVKSIDTWNTHSNINSSNSNSNNNNDGENYQTEEEIRAMEFANESETETETETDRDSEDAAAMKPPSYGFKYPSSQFCAHSRTGGVTVTLTNGRKIDADNVIITLPLGVLKSKTVNFHPPLPKLKQRAIDRMGMGVLNKCAMSFPHKFWGDEVRDFIIFCLVCGAESLYGNFF